MRALLHRAGRSLGWPRENALARLVTLSIAGRVGYLIVGFGASVALARLLGPANRGLLGLMISVNSLALVLLTFGVPLAVVYFASSRDSDHGGLLGNSILQALALSAVLIPAAAIVYKPIAHAFGDGQGGRTWVLVAALVPVTFLDWTTHGQLQGMLMFGRFNLLYVLSRVAYAIGILALTGVLGLGVAGGVIATALGSAVMIFGSLGPILARARPSINLALLARTLRYGVRVQVGSVFQLANGRLDVVVMQFFRPLNQVGYYVVAQTIAELVINLANAFQSSVMPLIAHYEGDARAETTSIDSIRHHGILAAVAVVGNAALGPLIIYFAFGSKFGPAIVPMLILLPGIWFLGMGIVIQGDLAGRGRPGLSSSLAGLAAVVTVVLDFALIPPLGVIGGSLASVVAYTTFGVGSLIALHRVTGISLRRLAVPTRRDLAAYGSLLRRMRPAAHVRSDA
jgi:O-antigen/teichoic acid export membrane protein